MARQGLKVVEENGRGAPANEERTGRLVALGRALSDPVRVEMLGMMAAGRGCCDLPDCGAPAEGQDAGICVCEFVEYFGMGQSRVSYHLGRLKEAGLVGEERRGKWSFYSLEREAARELVDCVGELLGTDREEDPRALTRG